VGQQTKALAIHQQLGGFDTPDGENNQISKIESKCLAERHFIPRCVCAMRTTKMGISLI